MAERLAMFPLGSVLVPGAVLPLHIFEPRYRVLMFDCVRGEPEFGVVLIERGFEVGGGDERFEVGTLARITEAAELPDGRWVIAAVGTQRIRVQEWLADDPYPLAMVERLSEAAVGDTEAGNEARVRAEAEVRRGLALCARLGLDGPDPGIQLAADPVVAAWQLVALAPLGSYDKQRLLEIDDHPSRLARLAVLAGEQATVLAHRLGGDQS
jgi:Lon protease-like protein